MAFSQLRPPTRGYFWCVPVKRLYARIAPMVFHLIGCARCVKIAKAICGRLLAAEESLRCGLNGPCASERPIAGRAGRSSASLQLAMARSGLERKARACTDIFTARLARLLANTLRRRIPLCGRLRRTNADDFGSALQRMVFSWRRAVGFSRRVV